MIKIALIDDHQIVRSGFAQLLNLEPDLKVVAEFGSAADALAGLPGSGARVCVCDISMPDQSGLELLKQLPSGLAVVMLSVHDSPALIEQALQTGREVRFIHFARHGHEYIIASETFPDVLRGHDLSGRTAIVTGANTGIGKTRMLGPFHSRGGCDVR